MGARVALFREYPSVVMYPAIGYGIVSLLDVITTITALEFGGIEANTIISSMGEWWILFKLSVVCAVITWAVIKSKYKLLWYATIITGSVVIWNIFKIGELIWK